MFLKTYCIFNSFLHRRTKVFLPASELELYITAVKGVSVQNRSILDVCSKPDPNRAVPTRVVGSVGYAAIHSAQHSSLQWNISAVIDRSFPTEYIFQVCLKDIRIQMPPSLTKISIRYFWKIPLSITFLVCPHECFPQFHPEQGPAINSHCYCACHDGATGRLLNQSWSVCLQNNHQWKSSVHTFISLTKKKKKFFSLTA